MLKEEKTIPSTPSETAADDGKTSDSKQEEEEKEREGSFKDYLV